jgi:hypothetical protein
MIGGGEFTVPSSRREMMAKEVAFMMENWLVNANSAR